MRKKIWLFILLLLYTAFVYAMALLFFACMVKCIRMWYIDSVIVVSCIFILTITVFLYKITV